MSKIRDIPISEIDEFPDHPFKVLMNEDMEQLVESVKRNGVMTPATVRLKEDGRYELISGHRRKKACELAGLETLKCEVKELTRDEAIIVMVESNLQRSVILPSEKAFAYKMRLEAMNRQGQRTDLTSRPVGEKLFSVDKMSQDVADSSRQIHRYIRLTELVPEILQMVDDRQIAFRPAVEISYLTEEQQYTLLEAMSYNDATGKLLPCHTCFFTGFLDCLSYRREIKVKIVISFIHKLTTCSLKILPLYFTEMWFLIERCEISDNKRFNSLSAEMKEL